MVKWKVNMNMLHAEGPLNGKRAEYTVTAHAVYADCLGRFQACPGIRKAESAPFKVLAK